MSKSVDQECVKPPLVQARDAFMFAAGFEEISARVERELHATAHAIEAGKATKKNDSLRAMVTFAVNCTFGAELYFKCLNLIATGAAGWGHELLNLYKLVPLQYQQRIKHHHREIMSRANNRGGPMLLDFEAILELQNDLFEDARYAFESKVTKLSVSTVPICVPIRRTILELKPEWRDEAARLQA